MVEQLIEKGYAYPVDGDVYFRVAKDEDYGRLSGRKLEDMMTGTRIDVDERKESPVDFALWKRSKPGEPYWGSPWGKGRPGWHIECSAMNLNHLGDQIDIHGGGNDLIFPHHENEIAQTESLTGKPFANYWVHNGMLQLKGEKMSKSLGNLITIEAFLEDHEADVLRMMILNSAYRSPLTFSDEVIEQTERALDRLKSALRPALPGAAGLGEAARSALADQVEKAEEGFIRAMDEDFNTAGALSQLFDLVRVVNQSRADGALGEELKPAQDLLKKLTGVLGLQMKTAVQTAGHAADPFIDLLVSLRTDLRGQKLYQLGDQIRDQLSELGVTIEDSKGGSSWRWK